MLAQYLTESCLEQMRGRVMAHGGVANFRIDNGVELVADVNWLLGYTLVCAHALHGGIAADHVGNDSVVVATVKHSTIADLTAGLGVERRVVQDDFAFIARLQLLHALSTLQQGQYFAIVRLRLPIALEFRLRKALVGRVCRLLDRTLPGGAGAGYFLLQRLFEALPVDQYTAVFCGILHKIQCQTVSFVQPKCCTSGQAWSVA